MHTVLFCLKNLPLPPLTRGLSFFHNMADDHSYLPSQSSSFQSSKRYPSAPSRTVNRSVVNTMLSYNSLPARLAFACHGPSPPLRASSLERQKPIAVSNPVSQQAGTTHK
jgi:hypothetical protein